jgi:hypothetical protein
MDRGGVDDRIALTLTYSHAHAESYRGMHLIDIDNGRWLLQQESRKRTGRLMNVWRSMTVWSKVANYAAVLER